MFDYWIEAEYEYWIVQFVMDYWINKQNHFPIYEFISLLAMGILHLLWV